jgi:tetratricopeptide (TPR) repeat protein
MIAKRSVTVGSHLAKYGLLCALDPTLVTPAFAASVDGAVAVSQGASALCATLWYIGHELVLDDADRERAENLTKAIDTAIAPVRKKYAHHWKMAEAQLHAIVQHTLPLDADMAEILRKGGGTAWLLRFENEFPKVVEFNDQVVREACEEALSAWLGVLAKDQQVLAELTAAMVQGIDGKIERLQRTLDAKPEGLDRAAVRRAIQALEDARALRWLKLARLRWEGIGASSAILRADYAAVPLFGREDELQTIAAWLGGERRIMALLVTGEGGTGKTRLLQEAALAAGRKHLAGFLSRRDGEPTRAQIDEMVAAAARSGKPLFAVIDYAETQVGLVNELIDSAASNPKARLRLALLSRNAVDWREAAKGRAGDVLGDPGSTEELELAPLGGKGADRGGFFAASAAAFAGELGLKPPADMTPPPALLNDDDFDNALVLSIAALARVQGEEVASQQQAFEFVLRREEEYWSRHHPAAAAQLKPWRDCIRLMAALVTMTGGAADRPSLKSVAKAAIAILQRDDLGIDGMADGLAGLYPNGAGGAAAVEPDRIGEFLVESLLQEQPALLPVAMALAGEERIFALLLFFNRASDWLDIINPAVAIALHDHIPDQTLELRDLAARVMEAALSGAELPEDRARYLNNLAVKLSDLGRQEEALERAREAVDIYRALAEPRPDAFRPDLAMSLNNLAKMLSDLGRREEALERAQEAVDLYRALAESRPDAFRPDLAMSLNTLAKMLSDLGRREEALELAREAVDIRRSLAESRPDAFAHDLANSISVCGDVLLALGRAAEAASAQNEALSTLLPMLRRYPQAFAGLAMQIGRDHIQACGQAGSEPEAERLMEVFAILAEAGLIELPKQEG